MSEELKNFLQNKFTNSFYGEFFGKKLLILCVPSQIKIDKKKERLVFSFEEGKIFELVGEEFKELDFKEFALILRNLLESLKDQINHYQDLIEHKENALLKGKTLANFFRKSFVMKQKLSKMMKFVIQLNESLVALEEARLKKELKIHSFILLHYEKSIKELIYRIDSLYSLIQSIKSEKTNKNIYVLSIISTIVLPLNIIVGFFGMNTGGLFLSKNENGTLIVLALVFVICILGIVYYKFKTKSDLSLDENFKSLADKKSNNFHQNS